jgi:outer membrane lipoprotein carrier protein
MKFFSALYAALLALCLLLVPVAGQARPIAPLEGLEALRKGFAGISDFAAEITQEKRLSIMKRTLVTHGTVRFRKPDLFMLEVKPPYESRLLLRDNVIEQAAGKGGERSRIILPPEQSLKQWFSKLAGPLSSLPEGVSVRCDLNGSLYTLSISPNSQGQVKALTISFLENGTIQRLVIDEKNGDRATMTFKKMRRNIGLTEKDFRLE